MLMKIKHLCLSALMMAAPVMADAPFLKSGSVGFVVSDFKFALPENADVDQACPRGLTRSWQEIYALQPSGKRRADESDKDYAERLKQAARKLATADNGQNLCMHPEAGKPDPFYRAVTGTSVSVPGVDLDGRQGPEDFPGTAGASGIDNQYYRVVGCNRSYQPTSLPANRMPSLSRCWQGPGAS